MMWVAIATAIMYGSGGADEFGAMRQRFQLIETAVTEAVADPARSADAVAALDEIQVAVERAQRSAVEVGACLERADRSYAATRMDYARCENTYRLTLHRVEVVYIRARARLEAAVLPDEWPEIDRRVEKMLAQ